MTRKAFTLIEVNLAMFIMAAGTLTICILYSFAFRESRQSTEDVAATAFADAYLGPLVQGLSARTMTWSAWRKVGDPPKSTDAHTRGVDGLWPEDGWCAYVEKPRRTDGSAGYAFLVRDNPRGTADGVFDKVLGNIPADCRGKNPSLPDGYHYGLVVTRRGSVIQLAFRAARRQDSLMSQPPFVAEVRFQGGGLE